MPHKRELPTLLGCARDLFFKIVEVGYRLNVFHELKSACTLFFQTGWHGKAMSTVAPGAIPQPKLDAVVWSRAEDEQPLGATARQAIGSSGFAQPLPRLDGACHLSVDLV